MRLPIPVLAAIYKLSMTMSYADDTLKNEEVKPLMDFLTSLDNYSNFLMHEVSVYANERMDAKQAILAVQKLDTETKQIVSNLLCSIAQSDREVTTEEVEMLRDIIVACELPLPTNIDPNQTVNDDNDTITPTFIIAQSNGLARPVQIKGEDWRVIDETLSAEIGASRTEVVRFTAPLNALSHRVCPSGYHLVFLVDRNGYSRSDIGDNMTGTLLYGSGHTIMGDIVFALETDSGYNLEGIKSAKLLNTIYATVNEAVGGLLRLE